MERPRGSPMTLRSGVIAPLLTPFNDDGSIAIDLFVEHAHTLLEAGCVGLAPFGTTGEGPSIGMIERVAAVDALIAGGLPPEQLVIGTGTPSVIDTIALTRHAADSGAAAVLVLPPFYFRSAEIDGLADFFGQVADAAAIPIFLYHIPKVAGIGLPSNLIRRLARTQPNIVGIKDSTGDWEHTRQLFDIPDFIVYPGSELSLLKALEAGAPGCISATANVNAGPIADVINSRNLGLEDRAREQHVAVASFRNVVQQFSAIPAQKAILDRQTEDSRWANLRAPLTPLSGDSLAQMFGELKELGREWP